jgi:hypothetical protein
MLRFATHTYTSVLNLIARLRRLLLHPSEYIVAVDWKIDIKTIEEDMHLYARISKALTSPALGRSIAVSCAGIFFTGCSPRLIQKPAANASEVAQFAEPARSVAGKLGFPVVHLQDQGPLLYHWTFSQQLESEGAREVYIRKVTALSGQNSTIQSTADIPEKAIVGYGLYTAGDPFVSSDYGNQLLVIRPAAVESPLFQHTDFTSGYPAHTAELIRSEVPAIIYNWRPAHFSQMAMVFRANAYGTVLNAANVAVFDFSEAQTFAQLPITPLSGNAQLTDFISRYGGFFHFIRTLDDLFLLSGEQPISISESHARVAVLHEIWKAPTPLVEAFKSIPRSWYEDQKCSKDADPIRACLRSLSTIVLGGESHYDSPFADGPRTIEILRKLGLLAASAQPQNTHDAGTAVAQQWLASEKNRVAADLLLREFFRFSDKFHASSLDNLPVVESSMNLVPEGNQIILRTSYRNAPAGKIMGSIDPGQSAITIVSRQNSWVHVKFNEWGGRPNEGWIPLLSLKVPGRVTGN